MVASRLVWAPWVFKLLDSIKAMPFVEEVEFSEEPPEASFTDFVLRIKLSPESDVVSVLPEIVELISRESRDEYMRTGKLPVLYWEVEPEPDEETVVKR